jgi:hypothetical protein
MNNELENEMKEITKITLEIGKNYLIRKKRIFDELKFDIDEIKVLGFSPTGEYVKVIYPPYESEINWLISSEVDIVEELF